MNSNVPTPAEIVADKADDAEEDRFAHPMFTTVPEEVTLDDEDGSALRKLNDMRMAVQQYVQAVQQQGEERLAQLQDKGRVVWSRIAEKHNLDLDRVDYKLNDAGTALVPVRMKLSG